MATKHISSLQVHPDNAANLLVSRLLPMLNHIIRASDTLLNLVITFDKDFNFRDIFPRPVAAAYTIFLDIRCIRGLYFSFSHQNNCYNTHY